jgi:cyclohexadienyl dehydratase
LRKCARVVRNWPELLVWLTVIGAAPAFAAPSPSTTGARTDVTTDVTTLGAAPDPAATPAPGDDLVALLARRLALMPQVAAHKWRHDQPIEDPEREAVVIAESADLALRHGLVPETVVQLFGAQIDAAKAVQSYWIGEWRAGRAEPPPAADLAAEIRPELSRLGEAIIAAAAAGNASRAATSMPGTPAADPLDRIVGLDDAHRDALFAAANAVRAFPNRLDQIVATGRLRIGTTGDYAPFSERTAPDVEVAGIDVDLARDLAAALGVSVEFVPTTWPTLEADLATGRYDIAMSGVSRTLARQRAGFLSAPYHADGKTPIGRCADRAEHDSLAAIDRPDVRVVVNPGGTNERFVDERVTRAQKIVHPDNRTIFTELLEDRADVMFTDRIEVELQARLHPELCALLSDNLTYQEKAYLLPRDPVWLEYVDTWLALRIAEGTVDAAFAAHGATRHPPR